MLTKKMPDARVRRLRSIPLPDPATTPLDVRSPGTSRLGEEPMVQPASSWHEPPVTAQPQGSPTPAVTAEETPSAGAACLSVDSRTPGATPSSGEDAQETENGATGQPGVARGMVNTQDSAAAGAKRPSDQRVRMGEALRQQGMDEHSVAQSLAEVVNKLKNKTTESDTVEKLLVDVLKECSKHLEQDTEALEGAPVKIRLIHNVARPQRNAPPLEPSHEAGSPTDAGEPRNPASDQSPR